MRITCFKADPVLPAYDTDWLSDDQATPIYWQTYRKDGLAWHTAEAFAPQTFDEYDEKIMSGKIVLATEDVRPAMHRRLRRVS